jgi:hypothetical protein
MAFEQGDYLKPSCYEVNGGGFGVPDPEILFRGYSGD